MKDSFFHSFKKRVCLSMVDFHDISGAPSPSVPACKRESIMAAA